MKVHDQFDLLAKARWWEDATGVVQAQQFLDLASEPKNLHALLRGVLADQLLSSLSERLRSLDKIVLLNDKATKTRLRLHYFKEGTYDLMHNHKWAFCSKILKGKLVQEVFVNLDSTSPHFISTFCLGLGYFLGPDLFHKLRAESDTVTLVLRGPDLLLSSQWRDMNSGEVWEHTGGKADNKKLDFNTSGLRDAIADVHTALAANE